MPESKSKGCQIAMKMIRKTALAAILCVIIPAATYGQNQESDSQTLKAILAELRAIHQDMQVTETTQLLVAELQMQQGVVNRAMETADSAREKLNTTHSLQQQMTASLERAQDRLDKATSADEKNAASKQIEQLKATLDLLKNNERDSNTSLLDMQQRLREAQDKLAGIEAELNSAVARLASAPK